VLSPVVKENVLKALSRAVNIEVSLHGLDIGVTQMDMCLSKATVYLLRMHITNAEGSMSKFQEVLRKTLDDNKKPTG